MMNLQRVELVKSAAQAGAFLHDGLPQIAFAGKSNVGKSSVLNCVLQRKNFARVGQKPGKTVHINYFRVDGKAHFVDLPGYGYAQVAEPEPIALGVMIVDARHAPTKLDCVMADLFRSTGRPFLVVANKLDKLKAREIEPNLACIRETLRLGEQTPLLPFSAEKGTGREALVRAIFDAVG